MRWIQSSIVVGAAWGLGASLTWMLAPSGSSENLWFGWWPWMVLAIAFLVAMLRPLLRGVLPLSVASIVVASAALLLWYLLWYGRQDLCEGCYRDSITSTSETVAIVVFFALLTAGIVGAGVLAGWEILHFSRRRTSPSRPASDHS